MPVTYTFANATAAIPLSQLDNNFATPITIGNVAIQLGNTVSSIGNVTLANATVSNSTLGNVTITSVASTFPNNYLSNSSVTIGNTAVALGSSASTIGNVTLTNATLSSLATPITTAEGGTGLSGSTPFTANGVVYASSTSALATGSALTWNGTQLGVGTSSPTSGYALDVRDRTRVASTSNYVLDLIGSGSNTSTIQFYADNSIGAIITTGTSAIPLTFYTGGSEKMRLTSAGYLGIGTSSPSAQLHVSGSSATANLILDGNGSSNGGNLYFYADISGSGNKYRSAISGINISNSGSGITFSTSNNGNTSPTEQMRLDYNGKLLVGMTSYSAYANGVAIYSDANGAVLNLGHTTGSGSGAGFVLFGYNGSGIGSIAQNGTTGVLYNITSDQRLKTNIVDAPVGNIDQIKIRSFDWKSDGSHNTYGVIAQELLEVAPYAVHVPANPDEMMGVDYSKLVPMMIKEIQSLKAEVATLKGA